ncbi:elongation factor P 5-aminopentanone reductase [Salisediminibacterium halotolerans]|uniref:3-oxoacyl-[acyl-carrier protein] reductase n=1 Tax=Salisediminibacterium halotolerans TaxID=517425 RepID=A0A1H9QA64_9BACI|nr:SDR family oxidoreductase [Salisediminibacterium haloalkalitolerans]SER57340.1 3-oxoacyl-[acyl-carrier protein] reductase [Salisediminibacterium haloalkalitolerans]
MAEQRAVITGASGGIGRSVARVLAETHNELIVHYFQNEKAAVELKNELEDAKQCRVTLIQADFSDTAAAVSKFAATAKKITTLVHCCGVSPVRQFQDESEETISRQIAAGLTTPTVITNLYSAEMIRSRSGSIVWITSVWGLEGAACESIYSSVKSGQHGLIKSLAKEFAPSHVTVNGVAPGAVDTGMLSVYSQAELEEIKSDIPAGYLGKPEDVANAVRFLISADASYINGQIISVNGAWHC